MTTEITDPYDQIIWSADVESIDALRRIVPQMQGLRLIKIDRLFTAKFGHRVLTQLRELHGLEVFDDAKLIEVPSKLLELAKVELAYKPWMLNCMAGAASGGVLEDPDPDEIEALKRFADACHQVGTRPCAVTVLTSKKPHLVATEFNGRTTNEQVLYYVELLLECGFTDVVCSPLEAGVIRTESSFDRLDINSPGIRPAGSASGDQARTDTPAAALAAGVTRLVIGRPLTNGNPAENLDNIVRSIRP